MIAATVVVQAVALVVIAAFGYGAVALLLDGMRRL